MEELFSSVNRRLSRYIFRPAAQFSLMADQWRFGVLPDAKKGSFQIRVDGCTVTESDAVIAMVRLNITGELYKVHLCDMCRSRWRVSDREDPQVLRRQVPRSLLPQVSQLQRNEKKEPAGISQAPEGGAGQRNRITDRETGKEDSHVCTVPTEGKQAVRNGLHVS